MKTGYKQTEVGVIPEDWEVSTIGDEFTIQLGKMLDAEKNIGTPKPYVGNRSVQWGRVDVSDLSTVPLTPTDLNKFRLRRGDLLACEGGDVGRAAIWDEPIPECYYQKALHRLRAKSDFSVIFMLNLLFHYSQRGVFANYVTQTSIAHLPKDKFETIPIPRPTLAEQEAIAGALSDADALIDSLEQLIAKKRLLKQGAMQDLLTGKKRLPGFEGEWEVVPLGDGVSLLSGHHVLAQFCNSDGSGYPYLTGPSDFPDGTISHTKFTTNPTTICKENDILITVKGSGVGTMVMSDSEYCISRQLMAVRVSDEWDATFVFFSLLQDSTLIGAAATGLIPGITRGDLLQKKMPIPQLPEQTAIAAILSDIDAEIAALEAKLAKARQVKQGMMQELLTGRVRFVNGEGKMENGECREENGECREEKGECWEGEGE